MSQTKVIVMGAGGRMGKSVLQAVVHDDGVVLAGACESAESKVIGQDAGVVAGLGANKVFVSSDLEAVVTQSPGVIVDFTTPVATLSFLKTAVKTKTPLVIGTTGFTAAERDKIKEASKTIPIVLAPNMSVGVTVLLGLIETAARILHEDFDMEVFEAHHQHKKDAPSGTAKKIVSVLCAATGREESSSVVCDRTRQNTARDKQQIGVQVLRGGDIVGEHTVFFCGEGERVEITHKATDRHIFARGAVRAAKWIVNKKPGLYDMKDVLGV